MSERLRWATKDGLAVVEVVSRDPGFRPVSRKPGEGISPSGITPTRTSGKENGLIQFAQQFVAAGHRVGRGESGQEAVVVRAIAASDVILDDPSGATRRQIRGLVMNAAAYGPWGHRYAPATHASGVSALIGISDRADGKRLDAAQEAGAS